MSFVLPSIIYVDIDHLDTIFSHITDHPDYLSIPSLVNLNVYYIT